MIPNQNTSAVTVLVLVKVGSRQETAKINGVSHFIEHMMFKGTKKRPQPTQLSIELESVGADYNAFTSKEYTGYYIKLAADKLELALDILSDMLTGATFNQKDLERERGVILEEINMYEDKPGANVNEIYDALVYRGHSLARKIIGPKSVISKITRKDLLDYRQAFYYGANSVVAVAGKVQTDKTLKLIDKYFSKFNSKKDELVIDEFKDKQNQPRLELKRKKTEQVHLALGVPAFQDEDSRTPAVKLLSIILGTGMSSRLFIEAREKRGLCYSIYSAVSTYEDTGDFMIKAGLDVNRLEPALQLIIKELKKLKQKGVTAKELKKAKDFVKGSTALSLEDSETQAAWYAREIIYGEKILTPTEKLKRLEKVTVAQVNQAARELFITSKLNLALIGPISNEQKSRLLSFLSL